MMANVDQQLPRSTPEQVGIASAAVLRFVEAIKRGQHELHSFMLLRHGSVAAEAWWEPYRREDAHALFSLSKSFTATAVGLAIAEGYFSLESAVAPFFPADVPVDTAFSGLTVRHLLTMATGQAVDSWWAMVHRPDEHWLKGFLDVPAVQPPGTQFVYNTGATYVLSVIVQHATGLKVLDFLHQRLFQPLGIGKARWQESPQGITAGGIGLSLPTEAIARFGQLHLQKGQWQGAQLLTEAWVAAATSRQINTQHPANADWEQGYGYQFWCCRHDAYRGDGVFGQYCIVMPAQNAVLAITAGLDIFEMRQPLNLVWDILLPAMSAEPLPVDPSAQQQLSETLTTLALPLAQGSPTSPLMPQIMGRRYAVAANALHLEAFSLRFDAVGCTIDLQTQAGAENIPCGVGEWQRGHTTLFDHPLLKTGAEVAVSGAWSANDVFEIVMRLYETPFTYRLTCHFVGDEMIIESRVNVSLESVAPVLMTARAL